MKKYMILALAVTMVGCDSTAAVSLATLALNPSTWTNLITIFQTVMGAIS